MTESRFIFASRAFLVLAIVWPTLTTWLYFIALANQPAAWQQAAYLVGKLLQFALPLVWWCWQRPDIVLSNRRPVVSMIIGGAFGFIVFTTMLAVFEFWLLPTGFFDVSGSAVQAKVVALGISSPAAFIALAVFYSLIHSFLEEYYWRWFVFRDCQRHASLGWAITISSLGFMAHHVLVLATYFGWDSPATYLLSGGVALGGAFWAWLYNRYHSLLGPWFSHLLIDAAIFTIGYQLTMQHS